MDSIFSYRKQNVGNTGCVLSDLSINIVTKVYTLLQCATNKYLSILNSLHFQLLICIVYNSLLFIYFELFLSLVSEYALFKWNALERFFYLMLYSSEEMHISITWKTSKLNIS